MEHILRLHPGPFDRIKQWTKTIETRLFDEKRQQIKFGDILIFQKRPDFNETIKVKITWIKKYKSFADIPKNYSHKELWVDENYNIADFVEWYYEYYKREDEEKYWVVVFEFEIY